ncbi:MAG: ATP-binding cassette domain-containing protein [Clostridia bacterium]|nr:ATP-binding cassette domain-containing protein [Clostridia bacterium]
MIKLENVTFGYKEDKVIKNLNLEIKENEFVAVIGVNGSGKSSLMKLIAGLVFPKEGTITIDEISTKDKKERTNLRKKVGLVFQNPENQLVFSNIEDDMKFMLENFNFSKEEIAKRISQSLEMVGMKEYQNKDIYSLSMGQKQRIAIAEMLALKSKYLLLDEPTAMLDPESKKKLIKTVKELQKEQAMTVVYATNIISEILQADRIIALDKGSIAFNCMPETIIENVEKFTKIGLQIPEIIELICKLNQKGIKINTKTFEIDEIVEEVIRSKIC